MFSFFLFSSRSQTTFPSFSVVSFPSPSPFFHSFVFLLSLSLLVLFTFFVFIQFSSILSYSLSPFLLFPPSSRSLLHLFFFSFYCYCFLDISLRFLSPFPSQSRRPNITANPPRVHVTNCAVDGILERTINVILKRNGNRALLKEKSERRSLCKVFFAGFFCKMDQRVMLQEGSKVWGCSTGPSSVDVG